MEYKEVPGSSYLSQLAYQKALITFAEKLVRFERVAERLFEDDVHIMGMTIRVPSGEGEDYLVTIRAFVGGDAKVAFHAGATIVEVLGGVMNRLTNNSLKWKDDKYAKK